MTTAYVRTVEETTYDGSTGKEVETVTQYQLGVDIDGVFVPFVSKQGPYIDALVARGKADQAAQQQQAADNTTTTADVVQPGTAGDTA